MSLMSDRLSSVKPLRVGYADYVRDVLWVGRTAAVNGGLWC